MKHKFYDEIVAWAKGEKVEYRKLGSNEWRNELEDLPYWDSIVFEYRIKPQPKEPQYLYVFDNGFDKYFTPVRYGGIIRTDNPKSTYKYIGKIKLED